LNRDSAEKPGFFQSDVRWKHGSRGMFTGQAHESSKTNRYLVLSCFCHLEGKEV
jgi:hypothetical protein